MIMTEMEEKILIRKFQHQISKNLSPVKELNKASCQRPYSPGSG